MADLARSLIPDIRAILSGSDLSTVSAKAVRKELVRRGADELAVKDARKEIDVRISEIYDQLTSGPEPATPATAPATAASTSYAPRNNHASSSSATGARYGSPPIPAIPASSQPEPLADIKPIKREHDHAVKQERTRPAPLLPPPQETDEQMAARLQAEYDSLGSGRVSRATGTNQAKAKKRKNPVKKRKSRAEVDSGSDGEGGEVKKKRKGGGGGAFNKELILSDALADLVGESRLSRPQTVKRIWDYVKERGLQDEKDKRYILCDDKLRNVFHSDKVHMFTMNKILAEHFMNPDEIIDVSGGGGGGGSAADVKPKPMAVPPKSERETGISSNHAAVISVASGSDVEGDDDIESEEDDDGYY